MLNQKDTYRHACARCRDWNSYHHAHYKPPKAICLWDGKETAEHVETAYCHAARYPFAGLGSVLGWIFWRLHLPQLLRRLRLYDPEKCRCAMLQTRLNRWGKRLLFWRKRKD